MRTAEKGSESNAAIPASHNKKESVRAEALTLFSYEWMIPSVPIAVDSHSDHSGKISNTESGNSIQDGHGDLLSLQGILQSIIAADRVYLLHFTVYCGMLKVQAEICAYRTSWR